MPYFNPCCCISLKFGGYFLALTQMASGGSRFMYVVLGLELIELARNSAVGVTLNKEKGYVGGNYKLSKEGLPFAHGVLALLVVLCIVDLLSGFLLIIGIRKENLFLLKLWLALKSCCLLFGIGIFICSLVIDTGYAQWIFDGTNLLWAIYSMWVINCLIEDQNRKQGVAQPVYPPGIKLN